MNNLIVPPSPNWFEVKILACASDNTVIYGSRHDLIIIYPTAKDQPLSIKFIDRAHTQKIISVDVNNQWGQPNKWAVTSGEDKIIKVWDIEKLEKRHMQNAHTESKERVIGASFLNENRVLSVSENGLLVLWVLSTNEITKLKGLFDSRVSITCFEPCPHASYKTAFGLKNGLIIVADLRKKGKVLFKLRGHEKEVISLSWCPVPINIFPSKPNHYLTGTVPTEAAHESPTTEKVEVKKFELKKISPLEIVLRHANECKTKTTKPNPWINLKHADDDDDDAEVTIEPPVMEMKAYQHDFLSECENVMRKIIGGKNECDERDEDNDATADSIPKEIAASSFFPSKVEEDQVEQLERKIEDASIGAEAKSVATVPEDVPETATQEPILGQVDLKSEEIPEARNAKRENVPPALSTPEIVEEEPRDECLLASSAKDRNIYVWRAGTDGRMQTFFNIPDWKAKARNYRDKREIWLVVNWIAPLKLITTSKKFELLQWILPKSKGSATQYKVLSNDHHSVVFGLVSPKHIYNKEDWLDEVNTTLWSFDQDRNLLNTSLDSENETLTTLNTMWGNIQCFAQSPCDPNRLGLGMGNGSIRIWNMSFPHLRSFTASTYSQKIQTKVTSLAWHPTVEMQLAFATEEGRIGLLDTGTFKAPTIFQQYFANKVHKIEWGPISGNKKNIGLYAIADGSLVVHNPSKVNDVPLVIDLPDKTYAYTFAWKPDYSMMVLCDTNGLVYVYTTDLRIIATYYLKKKIYCLTWHPDALSSGESPYYNWMAACQDNTLYIYNFANIFDTEKTSIEDIHVAVLQKHLSSINSLSWCPFDGTKMVTAGEDGIAQVWDVVNQVVLASYYDRNFDPITAVQWSPVNKDMVICGTKSQMLVVWKISDHSAIVDEEFITKRKEYLQSIKVERKAILATSSNGAATEKKTKRSIKNTILPAFVGGDDSIGNRVRLLERTLAWKERQRGCVDSGDVQKETDMPDMLQLFGNQNDMLNLLTINETSQKERGKYSALTLISLWKGNISTNIKEAIETRRVTPQIIALAPMVSPKIWQQACEIYASQLSEDSSADPLEIATYYLACHKIEPAIAALCERNMFKEALALAKCRLPEENPFVEQIVRKWAVDSSIKGIFETAAQCFIVLGEYEEAVKMLFRRTDEEILKFALELARRTDKSELIEAVAFRCKAFSAEDAKSDEVAALPSRTEVALAEAESNCNHDFSLDVDKSVGSSDINSDESILLRNNPKSPDSLETKGAGKEETIVSTQTLGQNLVTSTIEE